MSKVLFAISSLLNFLSYSEHQETKYCKDKYPIIIVGSGLAGHAAAAEALNQLQSSNSEHSIIVLEKESKYGGNSMKATSGINGATTIIQKSQNIFDTIESFYIDSFNSATGKNSKDPKTINSLIKTLTSNSADAVNWLYKKFGLELTSITQLGGHSHPRTHRLPAGPVGNIIVKTIHEKIESSVVFRYNCRVTDIIVDDETRRVIGVKYFDNESKKEIELFGSSVIFTTGGFGNDHDEKTSLLKQYSTKNEYVLPTTNGDWATGDGVKIGSKNGFQLVDMSEIQIHPTGFVNPKKPDDTTKFLAPEALRGYGGILINSKGQRFVNELDLRNKVVEKMNEQKKSNNVPFRLLLNQKMVDLFGKNMGFYIKFGLVKKFESLADLAKEMDVEREVLKQTIEKYKILKEKDEFGKELFPNNEYFGIEGTIFSAVVTPVIHYTMGGIKINGDARAMDLNGDTVQGFFAAGEVTGGVHGKNRLAGNSLLECVVYGRIAGANAAKYCLNEDESKNEL